MLKACFLPAQYADTSTQTCGEIVCENLKEFIIQCKLCQIKIFEFEEFVQHFKHAHLFEVDKNQSQHGRSEQGNVDGQELILKVEIEEALEDDGEKLQNHNFNNSYGPSDEKNDEEFFLEKDQDSEEEQIKSIMRKTRKSKELSCEICSKKYTDVRRLQLHIKTAHLSEKPYKCSICDQAFTVERLLKSHTNNKHTGHECQKCHKKFSTNRNLKVHMAVHLDTKEFICTEDNCGKAFATKRHLYNHKRYHTAALYICEECGYKCWKRDSLIVHKRHHTGDKPFSCKLCTCRFFSKPLLKEHMATHESERRHICDVCSKSFNRPKALYHHKHLHLDVKKFACKLCGQAFAQAAGLSAHMRKHREQFSDNPFSNNT